jgi:hypothetical protein
MAGPPAGQLERLRPEALHRHLALSDEPQTARQLADDLELSRGDGSPLPRPMTDDGTLQRVEGVLLPDLAPVIP